MTADAPSAPGRSRRWRDIDGILLLDKPEGLSSNAALQRVRRAFQARKAGHTGSLDPLASGLLPVCLGQSTKVAGYLLDADKTYRLRIALGSRTTTGDREGDTVEVAALPRHSKEAIVTAASGFLGETVQVPPMFSALKHRGERLYRLARKGIEVERPARRIAIHRIEVRDVEVDALELEVECSKGTYVRTLAEDLCRALGTVGHLAGLRRLSLGPFHNPVMHGLDSVESASERPVDLGAMLLPTDAALSAYSAVPVDVAGEALLLRGHPVDVDAPAGARVRMYGTGGRFLGMGRVNAEGSRLAPDRLMVEVPLGRPLRA